jgi:hypothetical protein
LFPLDSIVPSDPIVPFAAAVRAHDMEVSVSSGGTSDGQFIPNGVRWVVDIVQRRNR